MADGALHPLTGGDPFVLTDALFLAAKPDRRESKADSAGDRDRAELEQVQGRDEGPDTALDEVAVLRLNPLEPRAETEFLDIADDGRVVREDVVVEALQRLAADGEGDHLATDLGLAFEDRDLVAGLAQDLRGRQPRDARADDACPHGDTLPASVTSTWVILRNEMPKLQSRISPRMVVGTRMTAWAMIE